jgi:hypothetical protein
MSEEKIAIMSEHLFHRAGVVQQACGIVEHLHLDRS